MAGVSGLNLCHHISNSWLDGSCQNRAALTLWHTCRTHTAIDGLHTADGVEIMRASIYVFQCPVSETECVSYALFAFLKTSISLGRELFLNNWCFPSILSSHTAPGSTLARDDSRPSLPCLLFCYHRPFFYIYIDRQTYCLLQGRHDWNKGEVLK